jgi:hypothetical protein
MSYTELSMEEEHSGLMALMKCQFGDLLFYAPIPWTLFAAAFWQLSLISGAYRLNNARARVASSYALGPCGLPYRVRFAPVPLETGHHEGGRRRLTFLPQHHVKRDALAAYVIPAASNHAAGSTDTTLKV